MSKSEILMDLATQTGTDKKSHGYIEEYGKYLPYECRSMLEIGVAKGASAIMWSKFYGEDLDLHILDLFLDPDHVSVAWCRKNNFVPHKMPQQDVPMLAQIQEQFQVIIDDGSHLAAHQLASFKHLFVNNLSSPLGESVYFIEDCHCNVDPFYWGEGVECFEDTPKWLFHNFIETGKLKSKFFNDGESEVFESLISRVEICAEGKLIIIWKKSN